MKRLSLLSIIVFVLPLALSVEFSISWSGDQVLKAKIDISKKHRWLKRKFTLFTVEDPSTPLEGELKSYRLDEGNIIVYQNEVGLKVKEENGPDCEILFGPKKNKGRYFKFIGLRHGGNSAGKGCKKVIGFIYRKTPYTFGSFPHDHFVQSSTRVPSRRRVRRVRVNNQTPALDPFQNFLNINRRAIAKEHFTGLSLLRRKQKRLRSSKSVTDLVVKFNKVDIKVKYEAVLVSSGGRSIIDQRFKTDRYVSHDSLSEIASGGVIEEEIGLKGGVLFRCKDKFLPLKERLRFVDEEDQQRPVDLIALPGKIHFNLSFLVPGKRQIPGWKKQDKQVIAENLIFKPKKVNGKKQHNHQLDCPQCQLVYINNERSGDRNKYKAEHLLLKGISISNADTTRSSGDRTQEKFNLGSNVNLPAVGVSSGWKCEVRGSNRSLRYSKDRTEQADTPDETLEFTDGETI